MAATELGFTNSFLTNVQSQRTTLSSWLDSEKNRADSLADELTNCHADEVERIEGLIRRLDDVRIQRGLASSTTAGGCDTAGGLAQQKTDLKEKQERLEAEVAEWREKNREGEVCLNELLQQQADQQAAALASRNKKMAIAEMKNTTLDDLTKGLINYKYLGLGFESVGKENAMLFKFTKLDPAEPTKVFSFLLSLKPDNTYAMMKCDPDLDEKKTGELIQILNSDSNNGLMYFLIGMRKLFKKKL